MIVVEERLAEAFAQLPNIGATTDPVFAGFKPVYDWGDQFNLMATLKRYSDSSTSPYPLIYQVSTESEQQAHANECTADLVLYLAVQNTNTDLVNKERWAMSYRNVLNPLAENIEKVFRRAQIFTWDAVYKLDRQPNFGKDTANFTLDIWDVLIFTTNININANCIQETINFN